MLAVRIANWAVRIGGLAAIILGLLLWVVPDMKSSVVSIHMLAGLAVAVGLIVLALVGFGARAGALSIAAIAWAILLPVFGLTQASMTFLPHILIQVAHLVVGIIAIGLGEALTARIIKART